MTTEFVSHMFEVYYTGKEDTEREARILAVVTESEGALDYRELPTNSNGTICLTYEFTTLEQAEVAAQNIRNLGEYVEGPYCYGN